MALEQPGPSDAWIARPAVGDGPGRETRALARVGGSTGNRGRVDRIASERGPRRAVRRGVVAAADGQTSGPGVESAPRGPSVESRKSPVKTMTPDPFSSPSPVAPASSPRGIRAIA